MEKSRQFGMGKVEKINFIKLDCVLAGKRDPERASFGQRALDSLPESGTGLDQTTVYSVAVKGE